MYFYTCKYIKNEIKTQHNNVCFELFYDLFGRLKDGIRIHKLRFT